MIPFAAFAMLFSSARPTARSNALTAVSIPVISIPMMLNRINTKHRYNTSLTTPQIKPTAIGSSFVLFKTRLKTFINTLMTIIPINKTAKKITIFHAFVLKKFTISFQIAIQSIYSPQIYINFFGEFCQLFILF